MKIAVIGLGYWGPNLVRNFLLQEEVSNVVVYDQDVSLVRKTAKRFPGVEVAGSLDEIISRTDIEAAALATPVRTHYDLACQMLAGGKHCWIEKPMTASVKEAEDLVASADQSKLVLFVDHTFVYTGAVRKMKEIIMSGRLGDIYYFDSVRVNLGLFQHDVNVIWDLVPHDLSIMDYLLGDNPLSVSAIGSCHVGNELEDIAYLTLKFRNDLIAHFHVNWLAPVKIRKTLIGGTKSMIVYDDTESSEKVKVYDKGIEVGSREGIYETLVQYRTGDMLSPKLDQTEALFTAAAHFVECVLENKKPITDGAAGLNIVRILEASTESIKNSGRSVNL
jgi:predicted dehydrogenase